jgi:hypothetical protein
MKLRLHYEQQHSAESAAAQAQVEGAIKRLTAAVQDAFEAIGTAAKDEAVRTDVKQVGKSLTDALNATFTELSGDVRKVLRRPGGGAAGEPGAESQATPMPEELPSAAGEAGSLQPPAESGSLGPTTPPSDQPPTTPPTSQPPTSEPSRDQPPAP